MTLKEKNRKVLETSFTESELSIGVKFSEDVPFIEMMTYPIMLEAANYIDFSEIKNVFEIGSRDAFQALELNRWFPDANVHVFEAVPSNADVCRLNTKNVDKIEINEVAVSSFTGKTKFYEVTNGNVGASSLLKTTDHWWSNNWQQKEIDVDCIRMDEFLESKKIDKIDFLWMDVQGSERSVFEGFGKYLNDVSIIATEIGLQSIYEGSTLKDELDSILSNFTCIRSIATPAGVEADVIYINNKLIYK
jgi:FkbM family methyltransferase